LNRTIPLKQKKLNLGLAQWYENVSGTGITSTLGGGVLLHALASFISKIWTGRCGEKKILCSMGYKILDSSTSSS